MEQLWRSWAARQPEQPRNTQAAFLGFCKRYIELRTDGDFQDREGPRPALTSDRQEAAVREFQICGHGHDWAFARTEKQIIETAARMWGSIDRP